MACDLNLEFECPQFVDFVAAELNRSDKDDVFFDCKDHQSPEYESPSKAKPKNVNERYPTEDDENRLIEKMTAALSVIENTPKLKVNTVKGNTLKEKFSNLCSESSMKPVSTANTVPVSFLHRSKSIARVNKIITENQKYKGRKRSSSVGDLRTCKKQTYPMTPMCLKRTIMKAKKVIKTTEEKELEEIAKLQKQLIQHLRHNEISLKRLKLKPRPCVTSKNMHTKTENIMENKGKDPVMKKLNILEKEARRNFHMLSCAAMKKETMKIEKIIKGRSTVHKNFDKDIKEDKRAKCPSVSSAVIAENNEKSKDIIPEKSQMTGKRYGFHSGLVFHDIVKKNITGQPVGFDAKIKEKGINSGSEQKTECVPVSRSAMKCEVDGEKENVPFDKLQSTVQKSKAKCDIVKQPTTDKKIVGKMVKNPMRGLTLSENITRN